ncbi:hypothetical protein RRG08_018674 [Elysia crispata]|uniref:Uncharacterized protein n=1 Tax=Elysia crispata TaxID=231223 RepID=A0AAE0XZX6_9GAST|nr:hypothetical protein RRG08_018674 [Elysia crispata]
MPAILSYCHLSVISDLLDMWRPGDHQSYWIFATPALRHNLAAGRPSTHRDSQGEPSGSDDKSKDSAPELPVEGTLSPHSVLLKPGNGSLSHRSALLPMAGLTSSI